MVGEGTTSSPSALGTLQPMRAAVALALVFLVSHSAGAREPPIEAEPCNESQPCPEGYACVDTTGLGVGTIASGTLKCRQIDLAGCRAERSGGATGGATAPGSEKAG